MKDYKVKATRSFTDAVENVVRVSGDVFDCTKERYEFLKEHNAVELIEMQKTIDDIVEEVSEEKVKEEVKPVKKTTKKKSK